VTRTFFTALSFSLEVEKLDVTDAGDRKKALTWDVEILVNSQRAMFPRCT
jgi:hypothetical protein